MRKGFTLIELLTVIAIIGILAGILVPVILKAKGRARRVEVVNMVSALSRALETFKLDYSMYPWGPAATALEHPISADVIKELVPNDPRLTFETMDVTYNVRKKDYLPDIPDKHIDVAAYKLVDMWGKQYGFWWKDVAERAVVYSRGEDGFDDTSDGDEDFGDDINNL